MVSRLSAFAALLGGLFFAGCTPPSTQETPRVNLPPDPDAAVLRIVADPDYLPTSVTALFEKETGIRVVQTIVQSSWASAVRLLTAPGREDLLIVDEDLVQSLSAEGLLEPLDAAAIPNLKNIDPKFLRLFFDPDNRYSVPYLAGCLGIFVNTQLVSQPPKTFADLFRPEFDQRIFFANTPNDMTEIAWRARRGREALKITEDNLATLEPLMKEWLGRIKYLSNMDPQPAFASGEVVVGAIWNGDAARILSQDPKYRWIVPSDPYTFLSSFVCARGSRHKAEAMAFINFLLRPDVSKMVSDSTFFLNPNLAAQKLLTPGQLKNSASFPPFNPSRDLTIGHKGAKDQLLILSWFDSLRRVPAHREEAK